MGRQDNRIGQIEHIITIDITGAERQRLRLELKRPLRLQPRRLQPEGGVERPHAARVEPAARQRGAFA